MTVLVRYDLYCDVCGCEHKESGEAINEIRSYGADDGWTFRKVPNGSYWDFCPKCNELYENGELE